MAKVFEMDTSEILSHVRKFQNVYDELIEVWRNILKANCKL